MISEEMKKQEEKEMKEKRLEVFNDLIIMFKATLIGSLILSIIALVNVFV